MFYKDKRQKLREFGHVLPKKKHLIYYLCQRKNCGTLLAKQKIFGTGLISGMFCFWNFPIKGSILDIRPRDYTLWFQAKFLR